MSEAIKNAEGKSEISFHGGNALVRIATVYPKIKDVIFECTQNGLDSGAKTIYIHVNYKTQEVIVRDNGNGVSKAMFEEALKSVCKSKKNKDEESLGQFGIGLISSLGKCEYYTFTSTPKDNPNGFRQWTFVSDTLINEEKSLSVPNKEVPELIYGYNSTVPKGKKQVSYRTEVHLHKITKDRVISRVSYEDLREGIIERFGEKMRSLGTTVKIKITNKDKSVQEDDFRAPEFEGKPLPPVTYTGKDSGKTQFFLYLARKTSQGRKGKILMGIKFDPFRLGAKLFIEQRLLSAEASELLLSGFFEGNIISENCKLTKERTSLEENDALLEFSQHIEKWYREVGKVHYKEVANKQQDEKYHTTGLKCMKKVEELLKLDDFSALLEVVNNFSKSTVARGHAGYEAATEKEAGLSLGTKAVAAPKKNRMQKVGLEDLKDVLQKPNPTETNTRGTYTNMQHHTVTNTNRGTRRKLVEGESTGLRLAYEEMPGQSILWDLNIKEGLLSFNVRHPLWEQAERNERVLTKFQLHIVVTALQLELIPKDTRQPAIDFVEMQANYVLHSLESEYKYAKK